MIILNQTTKNKRIMPVMVCMVILAFSASSFAMTRIKDIARPLGQQANVLNGHGIVTGLNGTGDGADARITLNPFLALLEKKGNPLDYRDLKGTKNIAYVFIEATLSEHGQNQGDLIDVKITSVHDAKSLEGGVLHVTLLSGSNPLDDTIYAEAFGSIEIPNSETPTKGVISGGARMVQDLVHGYITNLHNGESNFSLIIDDHIASFEVTKYIKNLIEQEFERTDMITFKEICTVISPKMIVISLNAKETENYSLFIARVLNLPIQLPDPVAMVVINETNRTIAINSLVEIAPVTVNVEGLNITVVTPERPSTAANPSVEVHPWANFNTEEENSNLTNLINMLKQLNIGFEGQAKAIKAISDAKCLRGKLIYLK